nr:hypothetical protein [Tanacetum cinerariifolium]
MKGGRFTWTSKAAKAFDILKAKVTEAPVLALPNFDEVFQVDGYLFKGTRLCIPLCSLREAIILEGHAGGLAGFLRGVVHATLPKLIATQIVNRSLGNLLRSLIGDNEKHWDLILPQAEFAYSRSVNRTTGKRSFEVVYGRNPIMDLVPVLEVGQFSEEGADRSQQIKELHRSVQEHIIRHNKQYKEHADKRRRFGKLKPRGDGLFCVLKKINDNAYKIHLPGHYNVSATFNVADLSPYKRDSDDEPNSGSSLFQEGDDDADAVNERVNFTNTLGAYFAATNFCGGLG